MLRCCLNRKVIVGLAIVAVGVFAVDPHLFGRVLPLLFFAVCPLSMLLMMKVMSANKTLGAMNSVASTSIANAGQDGATSGPTLSADPTLPANIEFGRLQAELDELRAKQQAGRPFSCSATSAR